ncbi:Structural maintenance of chromosomes protein 3 [Malassezia brasiliensis]|uniref:Structural maintenance of chromosomes protein n=1 Tax=Malassezia brasiliensis TaxID=1821822 RepID=A0AAF0DYJ5_9BASI|nr:Structural maintenance of chromosomes protein 3 [Malassezia brasiliensis]
MYIKALTIHGFKSFRDATVVDSLSPHANVVVGRNGSGKSNFFAAIRFVLSDAYTSLSREERQALLYDASGATSATLSAFVEIVFDNSDGRFPLNGDEVVVRRTVSLAKDEYMIDRKNASKTEVVNLLESAGFSRSNPYYIVPQGRITHLTNATDAERLALLKEVAGTRVYEQRRVDSVDILRATDARYNGTAELLSEIEARIEELSKEQGELHKFHKRDRERRCLEYTIYQRELADLAEVLESLESDRRLELDQSNTRRVEHAREDAATAQQEDQLQELRAQLEQLELDQAQLEQERRALSRAQAQLDSTLEDQSERDGEDRRAALEIQLASVAAEIRTKEAHLAEQNEAQTRVLRDVEQVQSRLEQARARIAVLYAKQGRSAQFATQAERDAALEAQLRELDADDAARDAEAAQLAAKRDTEDAQLAALQAQRSALETSLATRGDSLTELSDTYQARKTERDALLEEKKELWKTETKATAALAHAQDQLSAAQRALAATVDRTTARGLQTVEALVAREQLTGVYGPLYTLFRVDDRYKAAVEATAGGSLFNIVVDTDATASTLLEHMQREPQSGRVTFMPLNRLHTNDVAYPQASDAVVMLRKLSFIPEVLPAMKQVFGKTIICPRLEIAAAYVRGSNGALNAITLDGDQVSRRGTLAGGYHDPRRSRLDAVRAVQRWQAEVQTQTAELAETRTRLATVEQQTTALYSEMYAAEQKRAQLQEQRTPELDELVYVRRAEADAQARVARLERVAAEAAIAAEAQATRRAALQAELGTPLTDSLSAQEHAELAEHIAEETAAQAALGEHTRAAVQLAEATSALATELDEGLRRTHGALAARLEALDAGTRNVDGASAEDLATHLARNTERIDETQRRFDAVAAEVHALEAQLEAARSKQAEQSADVARQQQIAERFAAKRQRLLEQRERVHQQIRDLGVLPEDAFRKYATLSSDRLVQQLQSARAALSQMAHVNKRAVEQYNSFTKQRDTLLRRHEELETSNASIHELITVLDARKDAALRDTFAHVAQHFSEVFAQLVAGGTARLELERDVSSDAPVGVAIHVAFGAGQREQLLHQLSGGQKSLVALTLVFAIQKSDPAPFYLFDEIDANLDTQYRTAVARMVQELAEEAQFIMTTFRPELVERAQKDYGVLFGPQKVSTIVPIARSDALEFVEAADTR